MMGAAAQATSYLWPVANLAVYIPFTLPWPYPVRRAFWCNGSNVTGNYDIGIYTAGGVKIWSSGSTAQTGASAIQYVTVTPDLLLPAGKYYLGLVNNGTTNRGFGTPTQVTAIIGRFMGLYQQATALPLPAAATFAAWNNIGYPLCGITRTASGF